MEGLWRNVETENLSHLVLWFLQWSTFLPACYMRQCRKLYVALSLDSAVCYPFMLLGQGSCLLCTLVQLVALLTSLPPFVWPVGTTILGLAENWLGCFVTSTGFRSWSYSLVDWGILPGSFSFSWNVLSSSSFSFCLQHTLFSICNEKKIEFVNREILFKIL